MRHHSTTTKAVRRTKTRGSDRRTLARHVLAWSAAALLTAGAGVAALPSRPAQQGDPPPVEPGDLLASTGSMGASLIDLDPSTGEGSLRFPLGKLGGVTEIVFGADGTLYGTTGGGSSNLIVIDPDTGEETLVEQHGFGAVNGLELVGDTLYGTFFAPEEPPGELRGEDPPTFLVTVNPETAELTPIGEVGFSPVRGLAHDPSSGVLYGVAPAIIDELPVDSVLLTIDLETGAGTVVGPVGHAVGAIRFGPDGVLYGGTVDPSGPLGGGEAFLITIDPASGTGAPVGGTGFPAISGLAFVPQLISPAGLEVDFAILESDGNGVFEPGEAVEVAPFWQNDGGEQAFADGFLSNFTGPAGASYDIAFDSIGYDIPAGESSSCQDAEGGCYELEIQLTAPQRPAPHWEATVDEELDLGPGGTLAQTWTLHVGDSFSDVPRSNLFYTSIETLLHSGVTGGCGDGGEYCPADANTRSQMPAFMLRALMGPDYTPPVCDEGDERLFDDVPASNLFCPWIEDLASRGIVAGCGDSNYCPSDSVTRAQMAIFLLKTLEGPDYEPTECTNRFTDVPCSSIFADWIEDLAVREITGGCSETEYCPTDAVTRGQMASFVTKTFGFSLYGP